MLRLLPILSLASLSTAIAQQVETPAGPGVAPGVIRWMEGAPHSDEILIQGESVRLVVTDSVVVGAIVHAEDNPLALYVAVLNRSARRFNVLPAQFALEAEGAAVRPLKYLSPQAVAKKIRNRAGWMILAEGLAAFARGRSGTSTSRTSATVWGPGGWASGEATTTTYDRTLNQAMFEDRTATIMHSAEEEEARQLTGALLATTLFPDQYAAGVVYFERAKRATGLTLRVPIEGRLVEIPLLLSTGSASAPTPQPTANPLQAGSASATPELQSPNPFRAGSVPSPAELAEPEPALVVQSPRATAAEYPWVGAFAEGLYFRADCDAAQQITPANLRYFATEEIASGAGFRRSDAVNC